MLSISIKIILIVIMVSALSILWVVSVKDMLSYPVSRKSVGEIILEILVLICQGALSFICLMWCVLIVVEGY